MIVSELITKLEKFLDIQGDLDVKLYVDHGQTHMNADQVALAFTEEKGAWMSESVHPDDVEEHHEKVCEIS